ncbi:hypothetical protein TNCV_1066591 [Trichonephila clavipes]|uniref:Uncharacterized protein n=1 Tax=Trichonephila clavipes TaxID=2585209 RepID=A0A8X6UUK0_TRICX|nr:hypothetical protein TNCV_1066591 [Trichonephila clavipes]
MDKSARLDTVQEHILELLLGEETLSGEYEDDFKKAKKYRDKMNQLPAELELNILKDNEGRRKQHSSSFMARREPRVLTPSPNHKNRGEISLQPKKCFFAACILKVSKSPNA